MNLSSAAVLASEAAEASSHTPGWIFGIAGFGVLAVLLVITMMINVDH